MSNTTLSPKGPKLNDRSTHGTNRDNLGITSTQTTMQDELCPVVNTVTPRAFYWPFLAWNFYDYIKRHSVAEISKSTAFGDFNTNCVKKNDYYFVLGCLLNTKAERNNLAGVDNGSAALDKNKEGPYPYNKDYLQAVYGGMQYYSNGVLSLGLVTDRNQDETPIPGLARVTKPLGEAMGEAFDKVIKETRYYKEYRLSDEPVPRDVIEELGETIRLDMNGLGECKKLLCEAFFGEHDNNRYTSKNMVQSKDYLVFLYNEHGMTNRPDNKQFRRILYDWFSPRGEYKYDYPEGIEYAVKGWEVVIGRQYFTTAIEIICKAMIDNLEYPKSFENMLNDMNRNSDWRDIDIMKPVCDYIENCNYNYEQREELVNDSIKKKQFRCENALKILFSIYNRFKSRDDVSSRYLDMGEPVSMSAFINKVDECWDKPAIELLSYIMKKWILDQNEKVAFAKLLQGRDGYIFERIGDMYRSTGRQPAAEFQGVRLTNLYQVIKDLDYIN